MGKTKRGKVFQLPSAVKQKITAYEKSMQIWQLRQMQALPLEVKVMKTLQRINEWYNHWTGQVYVSVSGKDSLLVLHLVRSLYPEVPGVFVDTGLEYNEVKEHIKTLDNIVWLKPLKPFHRVIEEDGYPIASKKIASDIYKLRHHTLTERYRNYLLNGDERGKAGKIPKRWLRLIDAPFEVSSKCCYYLKKGPLRIYQRQSGRYPITGEMAVESKQRQDAYLSSGCNQFDPNHPKSTPIGFWTEQDVLQYYYENNLEIPRIYGEVICDEAGSYRTTGYSRTGCYACLFGCHREKSPNRIQRLALTDPKKYKYCMEGLGLKQVMEYAKIPYMVMDDKFMAERTRYGEQITMIA